MTNPESLPLPLQRAVAARDAGVKPFLPAIETLDVSWAIVEGNIRELLGTIDLFHSDDPRKATAVWQQDPIVTHGFHLDIVRRFHNVLSSAIAHVDHSKRAAKLFKRLAPDSFQAYKAREADLYQRLAFAVTIRDFSIHAGVHASVLTLQGTEAGTLVGRVEFSVEPIVDYVAGRPNRQDASAAIANARLNAAGSTIEMRPLVTEFYSHIQDQRRWLRAELINVNERLSNDLERWAADEDRAAVIQYFIDHPISRGVVSNIVNGVIWNPLRDRASVGREMKRRLIGALDLGVRSGEMLLISSQAYRRRQPHDQAACRDHEVGN